MASNALAATRRVAATSSTVRSARALSAAAAAAAAPSRLMTRALTLEELDVDLYRTPAEVLWTPPNGRSVYGGQIAANALRAATLSLDESHAGFGIASFHSYFLLGGDHTRPIIFRVLRLRDGRSFSTRSVVASQGGKAIFSAEVQFHREESEDLEHQVAFPVNVPPPESLSSVTQLMQRVLDDPRLREQQRPLVERYLRAPFPVDVRPTAPQDPFAPSRVNPARQLLWLRCTEDLGPPAASGDPAAAASAAERFLHTAAITYASDWSIASTMMLPHALHFGNPRISFIASLDHVLYFAANTPFRADEWMLYELESPVLRGGRGLNFGRIYRRDGVLVATCVQEALLRVRPGGRGTGQERHAAPSGGTPTSAP